MARRPSFQFYPGDYAANTNLRRCTHEEKGVNMDFLCLAHDSDEYGIVRWPLKELAQAIGCKASILVALVNKNVIKGADEGTMCDVFVFTPCHAGQRGFPVELIPEQPGPLWYSSRMVRDEYVRQNRGKASRFISEGGQPPDDSPNPSPMPPPMPPFGDGSSSSSSSFNPLLRSDSAPSQGGENHGSNPDPVLLALPCQKGKHYHLTQSKLDDWKEAFPELNPLSEARGMKFWLEQNPTRQKTYAGMGKFISSWLARAKDKGTTQKAGAPSLKGQAGEDYVKQNAAFFGEGDGKSA